MKITIEPSEDQKEYPVNQQHPVVSVSIEGDDLIIDEVGELIQGALIAWGYHPHSVATLFQEALWK